MYFITLSRKILRNGNSLKILTFTVAIIFIKSDLYFVMLLCVVRLFMPLRLSIHNIDTLPLIRHCFRCDIFGEPFPSNSAAWPLE